MTKQNPATLEWAELEEHIRSLRRFAHALVGNASDADDLVQETLKRAVTYLQDGREIDNLRYYLLTLLHNARMDGLRRQARHPEVFDEEATLNLSQPAAQLDHLLYREVTEYIAELPEEQREVLLLVGLEGMSYKDSAEILGVPIGTIMSRLSSARSALLERVEEPPLRRASS
jgi:RNA polymerase sigma-70 factor (ECF subfamily)